MKNIFVIILVLLLLTVGFILWSNEKKLSNKGFDGCVARGGTVLESPRRCEISGQSFAEAR